MTPGSTVQVDLDPKGDEEEHPLKLKIVKPRKKPAKKEPEKVGVGAKKDEGEEPAGDGGEPESNSEDDQN
jgi:hypothetical protein